MKNFQDLSIVDYFKILRHRKWYLIVPTVVISIGSCIYAWRQTPFYKSETTVQVMNRLVPTDYIDSLVSETTADRIEFVRQQIRSRTFVERLVEDLQLANGEGREAIVAAVTSNITFDVFPPNIFKLGYVAPDPGLAQAVVRRLTDRVRDLSNSARKDTVLGTDQFLDEEVRRASMDLSQAEEKMRAFNELNFKGLPSQVDAYALSALQTQLATAEGDLGDMIQVRDAAKRRLQDQRDLQLAGRTPPPPPAIRTPPPAIAAPPKPAVVSNATPYDGPLATVQAELARLGPANPNRPRVKREVDRLTQAVEDYRKAQEAAQTQQTVQTPASSPPEEVAALPALPGLNTTVEFAEAELQFELDRLERIVQTKERAKQSLAGQVGQALRRLNLPAPLAQELAGINQEMKNARDRYTLLSSTKISTELAAKVDTSAANENFKIVDAANLPQVPFGPNRPRNAALGSLAGILVGLGLVLAREYLDTTLRDEDDASKLLKLPVLTSVPVVPGESRRRRLERIRNNGHLPVAVEGDSESGLIPLRTFDLQNADNKIRSVILDHRTVAGEQYRLMRTTLSVMRKKRDKLQTILIASTIPNEGKTFAACCLAAIMAQEPGKKVLLIDADFRTTSASSMLGLNGQSRIGLGEVLRGDADLESSFVTCADLNLTFLPAGGKVGDPTELLATPALEGTIRRCEEMFDWIIIDSPPILALADANILLPICDTALLVVRADKTPARLVKDSIGRIGSDRVCGVLMNGVRNITPSRYYGHYYRNSVS